MRRVIGRITDKGYEAQEASTVFDRDKLDDMLASRQAPCAVTDESFTRGVGTLEKQFEGDPSFGDVISEAQRHGYNPNPNDAYCPAIADFVGDPLAFVPSGAGARGHIKKVAELRNLNLVGVVNHKARQVPPTPDSIVNDSIVNEEVAILRQTDRHAAKANVNDLRQDIVNKYRRPPL